jgi:DNA-binding transcriptional LysR family regulator
LPPLNGLKAFEAFARQGRMTSAADELCVTHGAISRQIKQLEEAMGVSLIEGPRNRLRLTEDGLQLAEASTRAFDLIEAAIPRRRSRSEGPLEISCLGTFAMKWLIPRLPRFVERHPAIQVRVAEADGPIDLRSGECDVAIRMRPEGDLDSDDADVMPFLEHFQGPVLSPDLTGRDRISLQSLEKLPRLHTKSYRQGWADWEAQMGVRLAPAPVDREFDHYFYMLEAAIAGLGVAIGPWPFVARELDAGRLVAPLGFVRAPSVYVALLPKLGARPAARRLRDWLVDEGASMQAPAKLG